MFTAGIERPLDRQLTGYIARIVSWRNRIGGARPRAATAVNEATRRRAAQARRYPTGNRPGPTSCHYLRRSQSVVCGVAGDPASRLNRGHLPEQGTTASSGRGGKMARLVINMSCQTPAAWRALTARLAGGRTAARPTSSARPNAWWLVRDETCTTTTASKASPQPRPSLGWLPPRPERRNSRQQHAKTTAAVSPFIAESIEISKALPEKLWPSRWQLARHADPQRRGAERASGGTDRGTTPSCRLHINFHRGENGVGEWPLSLSLGR